MAVFLINICKFNGCEKIFPSLQDLIVHIEDTHIDDDSQHPRYTERTASLPLSCVLRFWSNRSRTEGVPAPAAVFAGVPNGADNGRAALAASPPGQQRQPGAASINQCAADQHAATVSNSAASNGNASSGSCSAPTAPASVNGSPERNGTGAAALEPIKHHLNQAVGSTDLKRKMAIKHHSYSISSSNRSTTPTGSEMDDDEMMVSESEDSNDSWTTEEFSSEFIMRYGSRRHSSSGGGNGMNSSNEKPFACPVPGCKKRYKNVNGIKYHSKNGHKKDGNRVRKGFKCFCGKSYKTSQRLKNHNLAAHSALISGATVDGGPVALPPASPVPLPSIASMSPVTSPSLSGLNGSSIASPSSSSSSLGSPSVISISSSPSVVGSGTTNGGSSSAFSSPISSSSSAFSIPPNVISPTSFTCYSLNGTPTTSSPNSGSNNASSTTPSSPSTLMITQLTHKIPRSTHLIATSTANTSFTVASSPTPSSSSSSSTSSSSNASLASMSAILSTPVLPAMITSTKYDNLGILTPATSPKLFANLAQDANQPHSQQHQPSASAGAGLSLKSVVGSVGASNGAPSATGETVNIALVVTPSANVGSESKLAVANGGGGGSNVTTTVTTSGGTATLPGTDGGGGDSSGVGAGGTGQKSTLLPASVTTGLYAEET